MNTVACINLSKPRKVLTDTFNSFLLDMKMYPRETINRVMPKLVKKAAISTGVFLLINGAGLITLHLFNDTAITASVMLGQAPPVSIITNSSMRAVASGVPISVKIAKACKPLVDILQAISVPAVTLTEMAGATCLMFDRKKGLKIMKDGAIAFLVIQFVPVLVDILVEIGGSMAMD